MFGTKEPFDYFECAGCGVLQICEVPADLSRHYPREYYAHVPPQVRPGPSVRRTTRRLRLRISLSLGMRMLSPLSDNYAWVEQARVGPSSRILDVGCGAGRLLLKLHELGFLHLEGVDPFVDAELKYGNGVHIHKMQLHEMEGAYDLVMAHHSLEHVPDPNAILREMARLCVPGGAVLLRVPLTGKYAWRTYGTHWVQLDAPRHLFLFTHAGLEMLARQAGLTVKSVVYDSRGFQIWGSEQYKQGYALEGMHKPRKPLFSADELATFEEQAAALNAREDGDQASYLLEKPKD